MRRTTLNKVAMAGALTMSSLSQANTQIPKRTDIYSIVRTADKKCGAKAVSHEQAETNRGTIERVLLRQSSPDTECISRILNQNDLPGNCGLISVSRVLEDDASLSGGFVEASCDENNSC